MTNPTFSDGTPIFPNRGRLELQELEALTRAYDSTVVGLPESVVVISRVRVLALIEEIRLLRTALRPFADDAKDFVGMPDSALICDEGCPLTVGDLRRAAELMAPHE